MKLTTALPAILLMATLAVSGTAYSQDAGDTAQKGSDQKEWKHHEHGGMWSSLPEEKRKLLKDTMEKVHKDNAQLHEQKKKLHAELDAIEVAPQFDSDAYLKKNAELEALCNKMKENRKQAFASILGQFSQEERVELVVMQHMMAMRKHHHHHGHHHHHMDGKDHMDKFQHGGDGTSAHAPEGSE